jgi:acetolactate synthase-1/3 small subunit
MERVFTLSALAENQPGVLQRFAIVLTRRKIRIESMSVSESDNPTLSRFTFLVRGDNESIRKVVGQMERIVEVKEVLAIRDDQSVHRELVMLRVSAALEGEQKELASIAQECGARISREGSTLFLLEKTGSAQEICNLRGRLKSHDVRDFVRSARVALTRIVEAAAA